MNTFDLPGWMNGRFSGPHYHQYERDGEAIVRIFSGGLEDPSTQVAVVWLGPPHDELTRWMIFDETQVMVYFEDKYHYGHIVNTYSHQAVICVDISIWGVLGDNPPPVRPQREPRLPGDPGGSQ